MSYARELGFAIQQISKQPETQQEICTALHISAHELGKLYAGRLFLTVSDLEKVADACSVSTDMLIEADPNEYNTHIGKFTNLKNREIILGLIDAYIDAKEMLAKK
ncbi:MAG: hypothetical protein LIO42_03790 [Oscillospiraceae bacterium]|nr:hypothetical protein [Oscillospiraceae bacterium]